MGVSRFFFKFGEKIILKKMTNWGSQFFEIWGGLSFSELGGGGWGSQYFGISGWGSQFFGIMWVGGVSYFQIRCGEGPSFFELGGGGGGVSPFRN